MTVGDKPTQNVESIKSLVVVPDLAINGELHIEASVQS